MPIYQYKNRTWGDVIPIKDDSLLNYGTRCQQMELKTTMECFESHRTKHYCHYGANPCYICPLWTGYRLNADFLIQIAQDASKVGVKITFDGKKWKISKKR